MHLFFVEPSIRRVLFCLTAALLLVGVLVTWTAARLVVLQARRIVRYKRTTGTLIFSHVASVPHLPHTVYKAGVIYTYQVGKTQYMGLRLFPVRKQTGTRAWAAATIAGFHNGQKVTVHYDPRHPRFAYLVPRYSYRPYAQLADGWFFGVVAWMMAQRYSRRLIHRPCPTTEGLFQLYPVPSLDGALWAALLAAIAWLLTIALPAANFIYLQGFPHLGHDALGPGLATIFFMVVCFQAARAWWRRKALRGVSLTIDTARPQFNQSLKVALTWMAPETLELRLVELAAVTINNRRLSRSEKVFDAGAVTIAPGQPFLTLVKVVIPPPTEPLTRRTRRRMRYGLMLSFRHGRSRFAYFFPFPIRQTPPTEQFPALLGAQGTAG